MKQANVINVTPHILMAAVHTVISHPLAEAVINLSLVTRRKCPAENSYEVRRLGFVVVEETRLPI